MPTPEETAQTPAAAPAPRPPLQHETNPESLATFLAALRQAPPTPPVPPADGETNGARIYEAVKQELERGQTK